MKNLTRKQAIDANCKQCIYDPLAGGSWLDQTEACVQEKCPLYAFRPLSTKTLAKQRIERYDAMSPEDKLKADKKADMTRERFK